MACAIFVGLLEVTTLRQAALSYHGKRRLMLLKIISNTLKVVLLMSEIRPADINIVYITWHLKPVIENTFSLNLRFGSLM